MLGMQQKSRLSHPGSHAHEGRNGQISQQTHPDRRNIHITQELTLPLPL